MKAKDDSAALTAEAERLKSIMEGLTESTRALRLEREMAASGASNEAEQNALNEINRLTEEREQILVRINSLQAGRAAGFREAAEDERDALSARMAEIDVAVQLLTTEQDLGIAARLRANEIRDSYRDQQAAAEALRDRMFAAYQVYALTRNMAVSLAQETFRAAQALGAMKLEFSTGGQALMNYGSRTPGGTEAQNALAARFAPKINLGIGSIGKSGGGRAGGAGAAGLSDIAREAERLNTAVKDGTTPLEKYRAGLAKLGDLKKNGLTDVAYSKEAARLNEELTNSLPLVGDVADAFGAFVSRGFSDFKSFTNSIMGSFKKMLADMIATAAKKQIMIAIGGKAAGGGGLLGGLLGGGKGGGLLGGLGGAAVLGPIGAGVALLGGLFGRRRAKKRAEQERRAAEEAQRAAAAEAEKQQRTGLENQIFSLQGNTAELRRRELEALAPANRALQERIWQLEDEQRVSEERKGLEGALLTIEGNTAELRRRELDSLTPANRELQERIWKLEDEQRASEELKGLEGELLALQGNTAELRRRELETLIPANREMQERIWQLEDEQRFAQERKGLEEELLSIEGNTVELRRRELDALIPANQELQKRIWQLQDEQRVSQELKSLEEELLRLQGNTAELRRRELAALSPANQEMQNRIWKLQEEQAIAAERNSLEEQLLRLQGNTAELRRRELAALDPSNRALQEHIWKLEDAAEIAEKLSEAMNRLNEENFATLLDFNRARAALAYGNAAPSVVTIDPKVNPRNRDDRNERLFTSMNNRLAQVEKYFTRWDIDGMPAERAA
jgi:hypothetical protein